MKPLFIIRFATFLAVTALGQSSQTPTPSSSLVETSSAKSVQTHVVTVGKEQNQFEPDSLLADVGDIIQFQFFPPNHSVGRAEYQQPCIPYEDTGVDKRGFFSGFFPLDKVLSNPPTWNLTINDTEPVFLYCAAPGSCINYQMVGVINPNSNVSLAVQKQNASDSTYMLAPGQPFPSEDGSAPQGDVNPPGASSTPSSSSSSTAPTPTPTPTASPSNTSSSTPSTLSGGAIAGIVVGALAIVALLGALLFLLGRHKTMLQFMRRPNPNANPYQAGSQPGPTGPMNQYHHPNPANSPPMGSFSPPPAATYPPSEPWSWSHTDGSTAGAPPYTERPTSPQLPGPLPVAELPSPAQRQGEQKSAENLPREMAGRGNLAPYKDNPSSLAVQQRTPSPQPREKGRPSSFWGRGRASRNATSELSGESPTVGAALGGKGGWYSRPKR